MGMTMCHRQIGPCQNTIQWAVAIAGRVFHPSHPKCSVGVREGPEAAQGPGRSTRYSMGHYQMEVTLAHSTISQSQEEILTELTQDQSHDQRLDLTTKQ